MSFTFHHSLASRAAVSVVTSLWYHEDIDTLKTIDGFVGNDATRRESAFDLARYRAYSAKRIHRLSLHVKVTANVSKLFIPESLKRYLLEFVQVIGENLEDWIEDHYMTPEKIVEVYRRECFAERLFDITVLAENRRPEFSSKSSINEEIDVDLRKVLRWNPDGDLDLEQTGEALVRNESDSIIRFRLACAYCKEDDMLQLWPSVQNHFSSPEACYSNKSYQVSTLFWWRYFHSFWPQPISTYLLDLMSKTTFQGVKLMMDELERSCFCTFSNHCSPLTYYLLKKIRSIRTSHEELRDEKFSIALQEKDIADKRFAPIFFKTPSSVQLLREFPECFFKQLLLWRHQSFFMDIVELSWDIFDDDLFDSILFHIALGIERYEDSDIYKGIFLRYWTGSPALLRDVERIFYDREVSGQETTLRQFVGVLFGHSPSAEDRMKSVLCEGRHVLELATRVRARDVLSDLVRTCLPEEEWEDKLELLKEHFAPAPKPICMQSTSITQV